jgi:hypothetical protein
MRVVSQQVLLRVLSGTTDANIRFDHLRSLLTALGFAERVKGSHHIFTKPEVWRFSIFNRAARWPSNTRSSRFVL